MRKSLLGSICLTLTASIWGGMYVVSKYVLQDISPFPLLFLRYAIGVVVLAAVLWITSRRNRRAPSTQLSSRTAWWKSVILFAWIGFIGYFISVGAQFVGTKLADAHTGALVTSASPAFIFVFARFILGERLSRRKVGSLVLAIIGVIVVVGWNFSKGTHFLGNLYLLLAAVTWALLSVYAKVAAKYHSSLTVTTYALAFALVFTAPVAYHQWDSHQLQALSHPLLLLGVLYLGLVSTALAFFLWNKGMELMDAGPGSLFFFFQPVVGGLFGWLLLREQLTWNFFAGGVLIVAGVAMAVVNPSEEFQMSLQE